MQLSVLLFVSSPIRARHVASLSTLRQWSNSRLCDDPVMDPSLKEILALQSTYKPY